MRVLDERDERAERDARPHHLTAAVPDDQRDRDRPHELERREEDRVIAHRREVRVAMSGVGRAELGGILRFSIHELDGRHAGDGFVQEGVEPC